MENKEQKAEEQADVIRTISWQIVQLDVEFCKQMGHDMITQASRQESLAVLNPSHPQVKNDILRLKGKALLKLCEFVDCLKEVDALKEQRKREQENRSKIANLFIDD